MVQWCNVVDQVSRLGWFSHVGHLEQDIVLLVQDVQIAEDGHRLTDLVVAKRISHALTKFV